MAVLAEPNHPPFKAQGEEPKFEEEREGWAGYWEWEKYPEKKKQVAEILAKYQFPPVCFMLTSFISVSCSEAITASRIPARATPR